MSANCSGRPPCTIAALSLALAYLVGPATRTANLASEILILQFRKLADRAGYKLSHQNISKLLTSGHSISKIGYLSIGVRWSVHHFGIQSGEVRCSKAKRRSKVLFSIKFFFKKKFFGKFPYKFLLLTYVQTKVKVHPRSSPFFSFSPLGLTCVCVCVQIKSDLSN